MDSNVTEEPAATIFSVLIIWWWKRRFLCNVDNHLASCSTNCHIQKAMTNCTRWAVKWLL